MAAKKGAKKKGLSAKAGDGMMLLLNELSDVEETLTELRTRMDRCSDSAFKKGVPERWNTRARRLASQIDAASVAAEELACDMTEAYLATARAEVR